MQLVGFQPAAGRVEVALRAQGCGRLYLIVSQIAEIKISIYETVL